jgi:hypothetical protein
MVRVESGGPQGPPVSQANPNPEICHDRALPAAAHVRASADALVWALSELMLGRRAEPRVRVV